MARFRDASRWAAATVWTEWKKQLWLQPTIANIAFLHLCSSDRLAIIIIVIISPHNLSTFKLHSSFATQTVSPPSRFCKTHLFTVVSP
jgi:hypothetical protein